jgi:hypothetical protein
MSGIRKHHRLDIIGMAQVIEDGAEPPLEVQIVDISPIGMRVHLREPIGGRLKFRLRQFADGTKTSIDETVDAQVVWIHKKGLWYSVGVQFTEDLNPKDHKAILAFLQRYLKKTQ